MIRSNAGSVILKLTYGIECLPDDDPNIAMAEKLSKITAEATQPGKWLCDSFPSSESRSIIHLALRHRLKSFRNSGIYSRMGSRRRLSAMGCKGTRCIDRVGPHAVREGQGQSGEYPPVHSIFFVSNN